MDKILLSPQDLHDAVSAVLSDIITIRRAVSPEDWEQVKEELQNLIEYTDEEFEEEFEEEPEDELQEIQPRGIASRREATAHKLNQRGKIMRSLGQQSGSVYERHRRKIDRSIGYMRDGNVTHYVAVKPKRKTKHNPYGKAKQLSRHDARYLATTDFEEE